LAEQVLAEQVLPEQAIPKRVSQNVTQASFRPEAVDYEQLFIVVND
jgi:hypothetical protein